MTTSPPIPATVDPSRGLLEGLRSNGHTRDAALRELHAMLIRGAHHELRRRWELLADVPPSEIEDLAQQAANDATTAIVAKLHTFRGESRFTTWAYKFVLLEAGVRARRRAWRDREVSIDDDSWQRLADPAANAHRSAQTNELLRAITAAIGRQLTPHQRTVFTALALNDVPIDVLAERMNTNRGALYKTLHDARRKLRSSLAAAGYDLRDAEGAP